MEQSGLELQMLFCYLTPPDLIRSKTGKAPRLLSIPSFSEGLLIVAPFVIDHIGSGILSIHVLSNNGVMQGSRRLETKPTSCVPYGCDI